MSVKTYPLTIRYVLDDEWMDCLLEMAGYGMAYWAHDAFEDDDGTRYTVAWVEDDAVTSKTVSRGAIARAVQKILMRQTNLNARGCEAVMAGVLDAGDIDSDVADNVIQVALFGEIVYG